jgi:two-component system NtrC family response regulator
LLLARRFLESFAGEEVEIAPDARAALEAYHWPGNVRELQNVMQRAVLVRQGAAITAADLPPRVRTAEPTSSVQLRPTDTLNMDALERRALEAALARTRGNVSEAVRMLGIGRTTAYRMMKRYGMR